METLDFSKLWKYFWVVILAAIIGSAGAFFYAQTQSTAYHVQAKLLVGPGIDSPRPDLNVLRASGQLIQTYAELPLTEPFLQEVIKDLQLDMQPAALAKIISVRPNPETQILTIEVRYEEAGTAQAIAYKIAHRLVELSPSNPDSSAAQIKGQVQSQIAELEESVADTRTSLQQMEADYHAALEYESSQREAGSSSQAFISQLDQFENENKFADAVSQREVGTSVLQEMASNTSARIAQYEYELERTTNPITQKLLSEQIRTERLHLSELRLAIAEINNSIDGLALDQYILNTQEQIRSLQEGLSGMVNTDNRKLQFDQINQLQSQLNQARETETSRQQKIFTQISNERERISDAALLRIENRRQIFDQIVNERSRLAELQDTLALLYDSVQTADPNQVKIIELAEPVPLAPSLSLMILAGSFAGALLAVVGILFGSSLTQNVDNSEQFSNRFSMPVIDLEKSQPWLSRALYRRMDKNRLREMYQMLGMRLLFSQIDKRKIILIGSVDEHAHSGIVAANLAAFLSQTGKRVLLVDANIEEPEIAGYFRIGNQEGLSDLLVGTSKKTLPMVQVEKYPTLVLLPFGSPSPDAAFLNSSLIIQQFERVKDAVDIILVSIPTLLRPDSLAFASHANSVIMVAEKGKTSLSSIEKVVESMDMIGAKIFSAVLSNSPRSKMLVFNPRQRGFLGPETGALSFASRAATAPDSIDSGETFTTPVSS